MENYHTVDALPRNIDGIESYIESVSDAHVDYNSTGLDKLYKVERSHFWFLYRAELIVKKFKQYINKNDEIIEIGAGTGNVSRELISAGYSVSAGELHLSGLKYAQSYGIAKCYQFDIYKSPFKDRFDAVGMFDVLEHLDDESLALKNIHRMLRCNGKLVLTVPAHQWLWSREDRLAGHKRRYTKSSLVSVLEENGFQVVDVRYFFIFIIPFLWLRTVLYPDSIKNNLKHHSGDITINPILNSIFKCVCKIEDKIRNIIPNVVGGSLIIVSVKSDDE